MNPLIQLKKTTPAILVALACFGLSPMAQALLPPPPPDGGYPNQNTAEGDDALFSLMDLQKVSAQLEAGKPAPQVVNNP